ncbi:hypothetical protein WKK05_38715 (plasmid) [Nostoc sp. UHCC 0302]|uniref:hypothetical protein n=1 Tax=Nostoc sp. UHCC 0302 TaxID=3134896 RepID=UPI00311CD7A9
MTEKLATLNLSHSESILAEGLFTKKVTELYQILANERVSTTEIRQRAKKGNLQLSYPHGILRIIPSHQSKSGNMWRWDVIFSPISWTKISH